MIAIGRIASGDSFYDGVSIESTAVLNPRRTVTRALAELAAEGGPELDFPMLAEQARVPLEWLRRFDDGQLGPTNLAVLERLCRTLGRSPNDLLGYEADL